MPPTQSNHPSPETLAMLPPSKQRPCIEKERKYHNMIEDLQKESLQNKRSSPSQPVCPLRFPPAHTRRVRETDITPPKRTTSDSNNNNNKMTKGIRSVCKTSKVSITTNTISLPPKPQANQPKQGIRRRTQQITTTTAKEQHTRATEPPQ